MLQSLCIENFILIENLSLQFPAGVCVLTGETGAGKSIIIDAVNAVLGGKTGADVIRSGTERARIEASFALNPVSPALQAWLEEAGVESEIPGELTLTREITIKGSRCRVAGTLIQQGALRELGDLLVDVLGQHEHTLLMRSRAHLDLLDRFGGPELEALRSQVGTLHGATLAMGAEIRTLESSAAERERQQDFWRFQIEEIDRADLTSESEEAELKAERSVLANVEALRTHLDQAHELLSSGHDSPSLSEGLDRALSLVRDAAELDASLSPVAEALAEASAMIEESSREVRHHAERLEADPERLDEIEQRLDLLRDLLRKYGPTVQDLWRYRERIESELAKADGADGHLAVLMQQRQALQAELAEVAKELTKARQEAALRLEAEIGRELADLGMKETRFTVSFRPHDAVMNEGREAVEFLLAPNPGEPPRPLAKTASGGELARLMLAMKTVFVRGEATPTLIFDEVDTGISGRAAQVVAQKIASLGSRSQILLITHMPAIAAIADRHWHIEKQVHGTRTTLHVQELDAEGQVAELAHLASGDARSEAAGDHARELLAKAHAYKMLEVER